MVKFELGFDPNPETLYTITYYRSKMYKYGSAHVLGSNLQMFADDIHELPYLTITRIKETSGSILYHNKELEDALTC